MLLKYPSVRQVFVRFNTALLCFAPVERMFTFPGKYIICLELLSSDAFRKFVSMKANFHIEQLLMYILLTKLTSHTSFSNCIQPVLGMLIGRFCPALWYKLKALVRWNSQELVVKSTSKFSARLTARIDQVLWYKKAVRNQIGDR